MAGSTKLHKEAEKVLRNNGFEYDHSKGSHNHWKNIDGRTVVVNTRLNEMVWKRIVKENCLVVAR